MRRLEREAGMLLAAETACCSVTVAQCHFLLELEALVQSSLQEIADSLSLDKSTLSRTVDTLVRDGFVERIPDTVNRRKVSLSLTESGKDKCAYINSLCNNQYEEIFSLIPKNKRAVVLERINLLASVMLTKRSQEETSCCAQ